MSEDVGRRLAIKFGSSINANNANDVARQRRESLNALIKHKVKAALRQAVEGFNKHSQSELSLVMQDAEDRVIFNFGQQLTLTAVFRDQRIDVNIPTKSRSGLMPYSVAVFDNDDGLTFRVQPSNPTINPPERTQDEFIETLLHIALNEPQA